MDKKILLEKFTGFCKNLSSSDKIAIVHHNDADGVSAAVIVAKALLKLTGKEPVIVHGFNYRDKKGEKLIVRDINEKANKLIIVDLSTEYYKDKLHKVKKMDGILVIDHHVFSTDINSEKVIFIHPAFLSKKSPSSYNASKLCFDIFSKITDIKQADWIASIGIIGDNAKKHWLGFLKQTAKRNSTTITGLEELEQMVSAVGVMKREKFAHIFWKILESEKIEDCRQKEFLEIKSEFDNEKEKLLVETQATMEQFKKLELEFYTIKTRFPGIKSQIINDFSNKKPHKTIILFEITSQNARFSARRQDGKIKVNELLENAIKEIPDSNAGGHIPAAAGGVPKEYFDKFKEQLKSELEKIYGK